MTTYFVDETNRTSVSEEGLRVGDEFYALQDIQIAVPQRWFNWEGMAVFFGVAIALFTFTSSWIPWMIALGFGAFGIYDVKRPRYKLWLHTDNGILQTAKYEGKEAEAAVEAIKVAILKAKADLEQAGSGPSHQ